MIKTDSKKVTKAMGYTFAALWMIGFPLLTWGIWLLVGVDDFSLPINFWILAGWELINCMMLWCGALLHEVILK